MANIKKRLEVLERKLIDTLEVPPAHVELINGSRTIEQQASYDKAIAEGVQVITIGVKDCRKESRDVDQAAH